MGSIKVNLRDIETKDFDALEAGRYDVKLIDAEMTETSGEGKLGKVPMIKWEFEVIDNDDEKLNGRKLWSNSTIAPSTLWSLKALLAATGEYDEDDLSDDNFEFELDDVIGCTMLAVVTKEEYPAGTGEYTNRIKRFKPLGGAVASTGSGKSSSLLP
jgi:hypothetical protein